MATIIARDRAAAAEGDPDSKMGPDTSTTSVNTIPPLGEPKQEKRFWFQRTGFFDRDAIATQASPSCRAAQRGSRRRRRRLTPVQPSVFDDDETAKQYQPPPEW
jgi:hypothetical protein